MATVIEREPLGYHGADLPGRRGGMEESAAAAVGDGGIRDSYVTPPASPSTCDQSLGKAVGRRE